MRRGWKATNLGGVHLVDSDNELPDTEGEGEESVFTGLTILGNTSLEFTSAGGDDEDGAVSLRGTGDHVLDEVTVTGGVDDLEIANIERDAMAEGMEDATRDEKRGKIRSDQI